MKTLWTPWRIEHVRGDGRKLEHCLFEPKGEGSFDKKQLLLYRDLDTVVLLNRFPYTNGHLLVAPACHIACLTELKKRQHNTLMAMIKSATKILRKHLSPDGFNIGCNLGDIAGAGIADHLHFHIVPRWKGDHNFMTVISEIRTIPEHINNTFDRLQPDFQKLLNKK